ncbi:hypothetical protein DSO57_1006865 [Entomophthora muscae]|uniref:Uncharacterized protein n=1 Tax=Entomophthora muscae TaxID=34485 RepID=A0ACC2SKD0_9FUNG|nr:hypothetical protein DSO57_1006865 [Entomophthora muscae]
MRKVLDALQQRNISPKVLSLIMSMLINDSTKIAINDELLRFVPKECGLFQESILLHLLYDIFIDDSALALIYVFSVDNIRYQTVMFFENDIKIQQKNFLSFSMAEHPV